MCPSTLRQSSCLNGDVKSTTQDDGGVMAGISFISPWLNIFHSKRFFFSRNKYGVIISIRLLDLYV